MSHLRVAVTAALFATACTESHAPPASSTEDARLARFDSCDQLETYIEDVAIDEMEESAVDASRVSSGDSGGGDADADADGDLDSTGDVGAGSGEPDVGDAPPDHSDTNVQEVGVDEADIVKTDGDFVYVLTQGWLVVLDAYPASELHEVSRLRVYGTPLDMFVVGDQAVVFTTSQGVDTPPELWSEWSPITKATIVSLADRAAPSVVRETYTEGTYLGSRRIDDAVHFVIEAWRTGPSLEGGGTDARWANLSAIRGTPLEAWVPRRVDVKHSGDVAVRDSGLAASCEEFLRPARPDGRGVVTISTIRLDDPTGPIHSAAVVGQGGILYASTDSLTIAAHPFYSDWGWWGWHAGRGLDERSYVHTFDLGPDGATPRASGTIDGHVLNQFSMDEEDGYLRVATTVSAEWGREGTLASEAESDLFILEEKDGALVVAGEIRDLAAGEAVYSARFEGDVGYVVTFPDQSVLVNPDPIEAEDDPLFTFDLSDPHAPVLLGALEIPGFSNYVHRIDEGHLLTIGHDADDDGVVTGLQVSLFDVTDLSNPTRTFTHSLGGAWAESEATSNHHAFSWFGDLGLLAVPITDVAGTGFIGARVLSVDVETGFADVAAIDHAPYYAGGPTEWIGESWSWEPFSQVRRALTIEDHLYTISGRAVVASPVADLSTPSAAVVLPDPIDPWN